MASNNTPATTCLTDSQLAAWHARELTEAGGASVREHLAACAACAGRAEKLGAEHNAWVERFRAAGGTLRKALTAPRNSPPETWDLPGYEILSEIRRGGQGIVFRALQKGTKREVALKVLREGRYASEAACRRFEREIELAATLQHPHIVTVFDSGRTADGRQFFAMDYIRGVPLDRYALDRSLGLRDKLRLLSAVAKAVNHAHQRGVIHRDLKPSNILVDDAGEPHILDFGLARPVEQREATLMTTAGVVAGTLPYMSPEQARGLPDAVDVRSDVYALGVILYELVTGCYPYPIEADVVRSLQHIAETPPERPSRARSRIQTGPAAKDAPVPAPIDEDVETIAMKALAKERDHRYQTAGDLARDIDLYLAGEPIQARRDSTWYVLSRAIRRHRLAALGIGGMCLVVAAALVVSISYWQQAVIQRDAARAAEKQAREHFEQVRALARYFVIDFDPLISELPGAAPARQAIVEQGRRYLEMLAAQASNDVKMQIELAAAYTVMGDIQGDLNAANLGKLTEALDSYRQAEEILGKIETANPGRLDTARLRTLNLIKTADVLGSRGDHDAALATLQEDLALCEQGVARHPGDENLRVQLVQVHERLGYALNERGGLEAATYHFSQVPPDDGKPVGEDRDGRKTRSRAVAHIHEATLHYARGEREQALESYRKYVEDTAILLEKQPQNVVFRRDAAVGYQWLGILSAELQRHEAALEPYRQSLSFCESLLRDDPEDEITRYNLATTLSKLGESQLALGDREAATGTFEQSLKEATRVADRRPDFARIHRLLGVGYYKMAELNLARAADQNQASDARADARRRACDWLQRCLDHFRGMRDRGILAPSDAKVPDELAQEVADCRAALTSSAASQPGE